MQQLSLEFAGYDSACATRRGKSRRSVPFSEWKVNLGICRIWDVMIAVYVVWKAYDSMHVVLVIHVIYTYSRWFCFFSNLVAICSPCSSEVVCPLFFWHTAIFWSNPSPIPESPVLFAFWSAIFVDVVLSDFLFKPWEGSFQKRHWMQFLRLPTSFNELSIWFNGSSPKLWKRHPGRRAGAATDPHAEQNLLIYCNMYIQFTLDHSRMLIR